MNPLTLPPTPHFPPSTPLIVQVLQWIFETEFVYLFCKSQENKRFIFKVHSLNLKSYVLVDDATSLTEELVQEFQTFLENNNFHCTLTFKKRFGSYFGTSDEAKHCSFKFVKITQPSNSQPLYFLRNMMKSFERKYNLSLKTFHMKIDPIVRIFQHHRNLKPCMFIELDTADASVKYIPFTTIRYSKGIRRSCENYKADGMYSFPIAKLKTCSNPPPFNFPIRIVAFDF